MSFLDYHDRDYASNTNVMQHPGLITDVNSFAERLKQARKNLGLSQAALAKQADVSQGAIANFEAGTRDQPRNLLALAKALQVSPHWLESGKLPQSPYRSDREDDQKADAYTATSTFTQDGVDFAQGIPSLSEALTAVAEAIVHADELTRLQVAPLLDRLVRDPKMANNIIQKLVPLLEGAYLGTETASFAQLKNKAEN